MTLNELKKKVDEVVARGHGDATVYFDSEAGTFTTHFVNIDDAFFEDNKESGTDEDLFILYTHDPIIHDPNMHKE